MPASLRVAFDANCLYTTRAGTARYTQGLLTGFGQMGAAAPNILPLGWPVENFDYKQPMRALKTAYRELIWCRTTAAHELKRMDCQLLHRTSRLDFIVPRGIPSVYTLYDLAVLRHPERFRRWHRMASRRFLGKLQQMDRMVCISRFTADEAMALLSIPASKLDVVYCGSDLAERFPEGNNTDEIPALPSEFFLFVGSLEPGKNLSLLKDVYQLARSNGHPLPPLLIAGARWAGVENEGQPPAEWNYLGRVSDGVLAALYRRATALVFPSKYEGFGLPVLEAMSLGCPVICSRTASLPEVGGEAACYCTLDAPDFLEAMQRVLTDTSLRKVMKAEGLIQSRKFSWRRCAEETTAVYKRLLE